MKVRNGIAFALGVTLLLWVFLAGIELAYGLVIVNPKANAVILTAAGICCFILIFFVVTRPPGES